MPVKPIMIPKDLTAEMLLAYIEIASQLQQKIGSESEEEFIDRRDEYYRQIDERAEFICKKLLKKALKEYKANGSEETDETEEKAESGETDSPMDNSSHQLFQYYARENPYKFRQLCTTYPQAIIEKILGDKPLAESYINYAKDELIDEALIAIFNYNQSVDSVDQFKLDIFWSSQESERYRNLFDDNDPFNAPRNKPSPDDKNYKEWVDYQIALQNIVNFSKKYPKIDVGAELSKKHDAMKKKYKTTNIDLEKVHQEIDAEMSALIDVARRKMPYLSKMSNEIVLFEILQQGKYALRSDTYINNDPELQNVFLQLKAFKEIRDSHSKSPQALLITADKVTQEMMSAKLYKETNSKQTQKKPNRYLRVFSMGILVGIPQAIYSYARNSTMFYANEAARKAGLAEKTKLTAAKNARDKIETIYRKLKKS